MTEPKTETAILSDEQIAEIEVRYKLAARLFPYKQVNDSLDDIPALCQTVRAVRADVLTMQAAYDKATSELKTENTALREQLARCEGSRRVHELDNHHNALACGYCAGPIKDEITRLQSQLEQVTKERDDLKNDLELARQSLLQMITALEQLK